ncbi:MAG: hypothetical protein PHS86_07760 [Syntrophaceae bacterium]|nr:hypothetical protein [Syntrophaceae bacterium]
MRDHFFEKSVSDHGVWIKGWAERSRRGRVPDRGSSPAGHRQARGRLSVCEAGRSA